MYQLFSEEHCNWDKKETRHDSKSDKEEKGDDIANVAIFECNI